jgi:hypothetical protein
VLLDEAQGAEATAAARLHSGIDITAHKALRGCRSHPPDASQRLSRSHDFYAGLVYEIDAL